MKLNKYAGALICAIILMFGSCGEDFLYRAPQGKIDQEVLTNAKGVEMLVLTAYSTLTRTDWGASIFNWTFSGIWGGDAHTGGNAVFDFEVYSLLFPSNSYLNSKWQWVYVGSKRVEIALQVLDKVTDMDPSLKKIRQGELYFLRALFYFEGVKVFGPYIPYLDETNTENNPKVYNDKDIYPNILSDVDKAIANLPDRPAELGHTYCWAAKTLKAKILMQLGRMSEAKPILADVINNGSTASGLKYALTNNLNDNWSCAMDNKSSESIFEIQFSNDGTNNGNAGMSACYPYAPGPGGCCCYYQPSFELVNSYQVDENGLPFLNAEYRDKPSVTTIIPVVYTYTSENDATIAVDPRLDFGIGRIGIPYKDYGPVHSTWVQNFSYGGCFLPKKHVYLKSEEGTLGSAGMHDGWAPGSAMNIQYLSLRDAMLLYAECLANDGELSAAMSQVNKLRARAALPVNIIYQEDGTQAANYKVAEYPASHATFTNKELCVKAIRMERKLELAMEGQRWFDLVRWGGDVMANEISNYVNYEKQFIMSFQIITPLASNKTMFPIPQAQINLMGKDKNGQDYLQQPAPWRE